MMSSSNKVKKKVELLKTADIQHFWRDASTIPLQKIPTEKTTLKIGDNCTKELKETGDET